MQGLFIIREKTMITPVDIMGSDSVMTGGGGENRMTEEAGPMVCDDT
jgi:hypothetical protein